MSPLQPLPRFLLSRASDRTQETFAEDLALVRAVLARCPVAVVVLGERMRCIRKIVRCRRRMLAPWIPSSSLADLEQAVALRVLECLPRFRGFAGLESWIFAFCDGAVRNAGRFHRRHDARLHLLDPKAFAALAAAAPRSHLDLQRCLDCLAAADRELVRARHWDGLRLEQLAVRLGICRNTVKSRYHRALKQLRDCLRRCVARGGGSRS